MRPTLRAPALVLMLVVPPVAELEAAPNGLRNIVLMVCDGCGAQQLEAANQLNGTVPEHQLGGEWLTSWVSTYPAGGGYDPARAWSDPTYPLQGATNSSAAATAMVTGVKTANGRVAVDAAGTRRLYGLAERARTLGRRVGAVTSVEISHATPGSFTSHNASRNSRYAIADEALFGAPETTGAAVMDAGYGGGLGPTLPPTDVLIGASSPDYVSTAQREKLAAESGLPGAHRLVEGAIGLDGGAMLLEAAADPSCQMLAGLFARSALRATAPDGGAQLETPSLAAAAAAALEVLARDPHGFVLLVEGGAVDWAGHANDMDWMIGELSDFNRAVAAVAAWVEEPSNGSGWDDTLVLVVADHETGYLSRGPGELPDPPLAPGSVTTDTLGLEKVDLATGRRASWRDTALPNDLIDLGETVYWAWNAQGHTNSLVPVFARGVGAERLIELSVGIDPVRGAYLDNTDIFRVLRDALESGPEVFRDGFETGFTIAWGVGWGG